MVHSTGGQTLAARIAPGLLAGLFATSCAMGMSGLAPGDQGRGGGGVDCPAQFASLYNPGRGPGVAGVPAVARDEAAGDDERSVAQTLVPVRFQVEEFDLGGFWNPDEPTWLTAPRSGEYELRLRTNFQHRRPPPDDLRATRVVAFTLNEREIRRETFYNPSHASGYWPTLETTVRLKLRTGDRAGARIGGKTRADGTPLPVQPVDVYMRRVCP